MLHTKLLNDSGPEPLSLRPREAARMLSVSERTLFALRAEGRIRAVKLGAGRGATVLFRVEELKRFLAEAEVASDAGWQADRAGRSEADGDSRKGGTDA
jgi:excisionase family DNA binding protein